MRLCELNLTSISNLTEYIETKEIAEIDCSVTNCLRTTLYYHYDYSKNLYCGLLVLGERHSQYDMQFYRQNLYLAFERFCIQVVNWQENPDRFYFELTERNSIIVDASKTLISFEAVFNRGEDFAKEIKSVTHYTGIRAAREILTSQSFFAKSLSSYLTESAFSFNENSRRLAFLVSLSRTNSPNEGMWQRFGKEHRGCKIDIVFKHSIVDTFRPIHPFRSYDKDNKEYLIATEKHINSQGCIPNVWLNPYFHIVEYTEELYNNSVMEIVEKGKHDYTIVDDIGKWVDSRFQFQDEVRILLLLWSGEKTEIPFIKKIKVPFLTDTIERVHVTIGNRAGVSAEEIRALTKQYNWLEVDDE